MFRVRYLYPSFSLRFSKNVNRIHHGDDLPIGSSVPQVFKKTNKASEPSAEDLQPPSEPVLSPGDQSLPDYKNSRLNSILDIDLILSKTPEEVADIWTKYHTQESDRVFGVVPPETYRKLIVRGSLNPSMLFPLPKSSGFQFFLQSCDQHAFHFLDIETAKNAGGEAEPVLSIEYFPELLSSKGIVLMLGKYLGNKLTSEEAQCLSNLHQIFYLDEDKFKLVEEFTKNPKDFNWEKLLDDEMKGQLEEHETLESMKKSAADQEAEAARNEKSEMFGYW